MAGGSLLILPPPAILIAREYLAYISSYLSATVGDGDDDGGIVEVDVETRGCCSSVKAGGDIASGSIFLLIINVVCTNNKINSSHVLHCK